MNSQNSIGKNKILYYAGFALLLGFFILKLVKMFMGSTLNDTSLPSYLFSAFFILFGIFIIIAVNGQYDYVVEDKKYLFFKKIFGEKGVKIFYYLLGFLFAWLGWMFLR